MVDSIRMLIVGTGGMALKHIEAYAEMDSVIVVGGVDKDDKKLQEFCNSHDIENRFTSVEEALTWGEFDAVSNVTPDGVHYPTSLPLMAAGKHILCEKPLALNHGEALEMARQAESAGIVHSINLSYRDVPAMQHAAKLVADGVIGEVRHFEASYFQSWLTQPAWGDWQNDAQWLWRLSSQHGSNGVLGDVGIHILDFATFVAGSMPARLSCLLHAFDKAENNVIGEYTLDANDSFVLHTQLENGALGTISATRFASGHINDLRLRIYGDMGGMEVLFENEISVLNLCAGDNLEAAQWETVPVSDVPSTYQRFVTAILSKRQAEPDFFRGAELQKLLDEALTGQTIGECR